MYSYFNPNSIPERPLEPPEDVIVHHCSRCSGEIYEGEEYFKLDGDIYCEDCFLDSAAEILMEKYGAEKRVAEVA